MKPHAARRRAYSALFGSVAASTTGRVIAAAMAVLIAACVTAVIAASIASYSMTVLSLLLLGVGWNGGFVAGSALLTDSVPSAARTRMQGRGDTVIWTGGAVASLGWRQPGRRDRGRE